MRHPLRTLMIVLATLLTLPAFGQDRADPGEALYGEWKIIEMIHLAHVQDLEGQGGSFMFVPGGFIYSINSEMHDRVIRDKRLQKALTERCVVRPREMDITTKPLGGGPELTSKALYELKDGTLKVIWSNEYGERPTDFDDAIKDRTLTLFVLKKAK
jgi:uncharacterized protein (TIGR03067 family)